MKKRKKRKKEKKKLVQTAPDCTRARNVVAKFRPTGDPTRHGNTNNVMDTIQPVDLACNLGAAPATQMPTIKVQPCVLSARFVIRLASAINRFPPTSTSRKKTTGSTILKVEASNRNQNCKIIDQAECTEAAPTRTQTPCARTTKVQPCVLSVQFVIRLASAIKRFFFKCTMHFFVLGRCLLGNPQLVA